MQNIFDTYTTTGYLHHAYIVVGDRVSHAEQILALLSQHLGLVTQGNPDVHTLMFTSLGVDEARDLSKQQSSAGFTVSENGEAARKFFIISADTITHEAQNALLKTFEEPTAGTHFFILLPRTEMLLPTLVSRVVVIASETVGNDEAKLAQDFLTTTLEERFAMIKKLTETKKDEPIDRERIRRFLDALEQLMAKQGGTPGFREKASTLYEVRGFLVERGSSPKMLLEHLAMSL